ncbi:MAG: hypothetical protein JW883_00775, partial [Deltaproteobacteria bacterium]|nr:hypothetical protein [Deltaproteobacteria bacterium]
MYGGRLECSKLWVDYWKIVELVAQAVYYAFPDRVDRRLSIGDATCTDGMCPDHPEGSHGPWPVNKLDLNYYTFGPNNTTQYRPGGAGDPENVVTDLWNLPGGFFGIEDLKTDVFDWERNYACWRMIREAFPAARIMIS